MSLQDISRIYLFAGLGILLVAYHITLVLLAPLSKLPGPWYSKWTDLVSTYYWLRGTQPIYVHRLHQSYGPLVRTGPDNVDVNSMDAVKAIYNIKNEYPKSPWYLNIAGVNEHDVFSTPDIDFHRRHRRVLGGSMSESALKAYIPAVTSRVDFAISRMREELNNEGAVDISKWWLFMTTDVIGELTFGESFKTLEQGKKSAYTKDLELAAPLAAVRTTFPSLLPILRHIPLKAIQVPVESGHNVARYAQESISRYQNLLASDPTRARSTLFTRVFQAKDDNRMTIEEIQSDARVFIVAGTDTTSNTLTYLVWSVCHHTEVKAKLMEELNSLPEGYTDEDLQKLPYLANVIEETLRLHPVVPSALPREVPPSGASLAGHWVPGGVTVSCQSYSMHRDPQAFPDAERFMPERWENPTKEMKEAFMAFGRGSRVCLGIHLAYMELRLGAAKFFLEFPSAKRSSKFGMTDEDMEPLLFFLITPKGHRCLIDE